MSDFINQLEQIQITLNKLKVVIREQKDECKILLDKIEEEDNKKLEYKTNIENYKKYSKMNNSIELELFENKEKKRILKEKMEHSKSIINHYHKDKYNNLLLNNLEDYLKL